MSMTLEEAIEHAEEQAIRNEKEAERKREYGGEFYDSEVKACLICAEQHRQLAEWLKELAERRKQPERKWIPCSETVDIPDHEVMACDRYGEFIIGYLDCKDEQWLCESDDSLMYDPVAWCELPKPYKEGGTDG